MIILLGPYNLITANCQTFSDEFLKQLGSGGYMTYVKTAKTIGVVSGIVGAIAIGIAGVAAGLLWSSKKNEEAYDEEDDE